MNLHNNYLEVRCPSFSENGDIPKRHTGFGEDISPEIIPYGAECKDGAKQGKAWGKHRYRFTVYGLDCMLDLPPASGKADLKKAMSGHIVQSGAVTGWYKP